MSDKERDIRISIKGLREMEYHYSDPSISNPEIKQEAKNKLESQIRLKLEWNFEDDFLAVFTNLIVNVLWQDKKVNVLNYLCVTDFHVESLSNYVNEDEEGNQKVDADLAETLVKMAIAHGRGMLFQKTSLTPFRRFAFPLVNIKEVLQLDGLDSSGDKSL